MDNYTFSSDIGCTLADIRATSVLSERFFQTTQHPGDFQVCEANDLFIYERMPWCSNVIKQNLEVVGFTFCFPTTPEDAASFVSRALSERDLFERLKVNLKPLPCTALYLCATVIAPEHRGRALSYRAFLKTFEKIKVTKENTTLVSWPQTNEGKRLAKICERKGYRLLTRED